MYGLLVGTKEPEKIDTREPRLIIVLAIVVVTLPVLIMIALLIGLLGTALILGYQTLVVLELGKGLLKGTKWTK